MRQKQDKWDLNRLPTKGERLVGITGGIVVALILGGISLLAYISKSYIVAFVFAVFSVCIARIAYKAAFTQAELPSTRSIRAVNYIILLCGVGMVLASPFSPDAAGKMYMLSGGFSALGVGMRNLISHRNKANSA